MSPEQRMAGRAGPIDARTDVFALGAVLQELLGSDVPDDVTRVLRKALDEDPDHRFSTAAEFAAALPRPSSGASDLGAVTRLARRPKVAIPAVLVVLLALMAVWVPGRARARRERGREQLARASLLADSGRFEEAYAAWTQAERALRGDSAVAKEMPKVADILTVTSEPSGARVWIQRFDPAAAQTRDSVLLGETPLRERRMARGDYRLVITKDGFIPATTLTATHGTRPRLAGFRIPGPREVAVRLANADSAAKDMVFVPGGPYRLAGPSMPLGQETDLADFLLDNYEVSNEQYRAFVASGGYRRPELARFADRSGMPGPRGWTGQEYPAGRDRKSVV